MFQLFLSVAVSADDDDDLENTGPEQSEAADRVIETVGELSETPLRLGVARRRLRRDGFKEFLGILISTAIGAFTITEGETGELADPTHILSRLLGVTPGRHKAAVPPSPLLSDWEGTRRKSRGDGAVFAADCKLDFAGHDN